MASISVGGGESWFAINLGSTTTDTYGRYSIRVPRSAEYHLIVNTREIQHGHYRFYDHTWSRRAVEYAPLICMNFTLEPAGSIIVKMFGTSGRALGFNSMESSWVKDVWLASLSGEEMEWNRTKAHTEQPYRSDDEELILLSPEGTPTMVLAEVRVPSYGGLKVTIDNESKGLRMRPGDLLVLNLNYEVARSAYREFDLCFGAMANRTASLRQRIASISEHLVNAQRYRLQDKDATCANESNAVLFGVLQLRSHMWLDISFRPEHPRLFFTSSDIQAIKDKVRSGFPQQMWKSILSDCRKFLALPAPELSARSASEYMSWYDVGDTAVTRMQYLALTYVITGDTRYADKAKEIMWAVLSWSSWIDLDEGGEPGLMMGRVTGGVAIIYDWLYDYLTIDERSTVMKAVAEKGAEPLYQASIDGIWWNDRSRCNWNSVTHGGMGLAGLAFLGEYENASRWVSLAASKIRKYFDSGGKNGGWGEGLHYWFYGLVPAVLFSDALRRVTLLDLYQSDFLRETLYFPLYLMTPGLERHANFGDSWLGVGAISWTATLTLRLSSEYRDGHGQKFFNLLMEKHVVGADAAPWALIWYDNSVNPEPLDDLPLSRMFEGLGWVVVRSGWGPQDVFLAFKSGPNWNHGHADQNSFILEAFGEPLIVDLGAGRYSADYFEGNLDYHMASIGHNVVLLDGHGQVDPRPGWRGQTPSGTILSFQTQAGPEPYTQMVGDASTTYPMPVKFIRQIVFVPPRTIVLLDRVEAPSSSEFQWLVHTTGKFKIDGSDITIVKDNALLAMKFLLPQRFNWTIHHDQTVTTNWQTEEPAAYVEVSTLERATSAVFLAVLYPARPGENIPPISLVENRTTWTIKIGEGTTVAVAKEETQLVALVTTSTTSGLPIVSTTVTPAGESPTWILWFQTGAFYVALAIVVVAIVVVLITRKHRSGSE
jgi:hypothetical protein